MKYLFKVYVCTMDEVAFTIINRWQGCVTILQNCYDKKKKSFPSHSWSLPKGFVYCVP